MKKEQDPLENFCKNLEVVGGKTFNMLGTLIGAIFIKLALWLENKASKGD